jgi:hypothetical protein
LEDFDMSTEEANGKVQPDFSDLRFTDSSGGKLDYWILDDDPSSLDVWVRADNIPDGTSNFYMYYGNPSASAGSSAKKVGELVENYGFEDTSKGTGNNVDVAVWDTTNVGSHCDGPPCFDLDGSKANSGDYGYGEEGCCDDCEGNPTSGGVGGGYMSQKISIEGGKDLYAEMMARIKVYPYQCPRWDGDSETSCNEGQVCIGEDDARLVLIAYDSDGNEVGRKYSNWGLEIRAENGDTGGHNGWQKFSVDWQTPVDTDEVEIRLYHSDGNDSICFDWDFLERGNGASYYDDIILMERPSVSSDLIVGSPGTEEKSPGPVGHWSFDEGYGSTAHDESSQGNDGTINGATWKPESQCVSGKCLYFDGSDDYVEIDEANSLKWSASDSFTKSAWVKRNNNDASNYQGIFQQERTHIGIDKTSGVCSDSFEVYSNIGGSPTCSDFILEQGEWYYVTVVYNNTNVKIYINGDEKVSTTKTLESQSGSENYLGSTSLTANFFNGFIDEVKIYPYARTAEQIKADYNAGKAGAKSSKGVKMSAGGDPKSWMSDGLVGYWKMDEDDWNGTAGEVIDSSGNGNNGTASGGATTTAGKFGNGGDFDGSDDKIVVNDDDTLEFSTSTITISTWVKTTHYASSWDNIMSKTAGSGNDRERGWIFTYYEGKPGISVESNHIVTSNKAIDDGNWHHVVVQVITTNTEDTYKRVFIDGELTSEELSALNIKNDETDLEISHGGRFPGQLDEIRIYNRALSESEVKDLYLWAPGPVAHYNLDRGEGTTAYDISGNGNSGTFGGDPRWTLGKYGKALDFDGSDDYVDIPHEIANEAPFTYSAWVYINGSTGTGQYIIGNGAQSYSEGGTILYNVSSGNIEFPVQTNGLHGGVGTSIDFDKWNHIAGTWDGTNSSNSIKLYKNGFLAVEGTASTHSEDPQEPGLTLGTPDNSKGNYVLNGKVDEVKIYDYARTPRQIAMDYNGGKPVGWWKMDEGSGTDVHDYTDNVNHGTMVNMDSGTDWVEGKRNSALDFDGSDDYVNLGNSDDINLSSNFTITGWVNRDADGYESIVARGNNLTNDSQYYIRAQPTSASCAPGSIRFSINNGSYICGNTDLTDGKWHFFAASYNSSTMKIYIDNGSHEDSKTVSSNVVLSRDVVVGADSDKNSNFDGQIDDVRIYNYALTEDDIRRIYNGGAVNFN